MRTTQRLWKSRPWNPIKNQNHTHQGDSGKRNKTVTLLCIIETEVQGAIFSMASKGSIRVKSNYALEDLGRKLDERKQSEDIRLDFVKALNKVKKSK